MLIFCYLILYFLIYSILGWICEMFFCYVIDKETDNRGFLFGPYCPIYGTGGLIISYALIPFRDNILIVFILSVLISSILEYATSYVLEKIFNKKWWDYSHKRFNLQGRVCLGNSILFGIMGILTIYIIHPYIVDTITALPTIYAPIFALLVFTILLSDFIVTVNVLLHSNEITQTEKISKKIDRI